ncbi:methyltransferase [Flexivirga meconopsidis]|uniref:methyltransferase n=1 Tax=Flexivirga meconopsidis TaxID=2977121 RepID=UPI0022406603
MIELLTGGWRAQLARVGVELRIPDLLTAADRTVAELSTRTAVPQDLMYRLMRGLDSIGIAERLPYELGRITEAGATYTLGPLGVHLVDAPGSMRDACLLYGGEFHSAWGNAPAAFGSGSTGFEATYGTELIPYLAANPPAAKRFQSALAATSFYFDLLADALEVPVHGVVVDIAGGSGALLARVLQARPRARGVLTDLPHMVAIADGTFVDAGLTERVTTMPLDLFSGRLPQDADTYVLSRVLGDWSNEECERILTNIKVSMGHESRLWIVERLTRDDGSAPLATLWDLHLHVINGGRQRSIREYQRLAKECGLEIVEDKRLPADNAALALRLR